MNKKEMAISFLRLASSGNVREAYETYVHPDFRHHNPYVPGDRASLLAAMEENAATFPQKEFEVLRALEDGYLVAIHGRLGMSRTRPWIATRSTSFASRTTRLSRSGKPVRKCRKTLQISMGLFDQISSCRPRKEPEQSAAGRF